jgi:hypothetical protein
MVADISVDLQWVRRQPEKCDEIAKAIRNQLSTAEDATDALKTAAEGFELIDSLPQMMERWEDLNDLLFERLQDAGERFYQCADRFDENETNAIDLLRNLLT